jgi:threonine dehydratase
MDLVTLDDIRKAAERIKGSAVRTPLLSASWTGRDVFCKPENLQPVGSFKIRGATNAVAMLGGPGRTSAVVTHSSGNHAQALAYAARAAGLVATVVMPTQAPEVKVVATRALGATVVQVSADDRERVAAEIAEKDGAASVPPYDDAAVIAGQGTIGLEIAEDLPGLAAVLVPVSGGGLISGIAVAIKALCPRAKVIACEPELAADLAESFAAGELRAWTSGQTARTMADGLRVPVVGDLPWQLIRAHVDDVLTVSEDAIGAAVRMLALRGRLVSEPSGAVATAALLEHGSMLPDGPIVTVVSGGNVIPDQFVQLMAGRHRLGGGVPDLGGDPRSSV